MKQTPILFSTEMVQAILDGRKSQTRRVVKDKMLQENTAADTEEYLKLTTICPFGYPGDVLWVREEHLITFSSDRTVIYIEYKDGFSQSFYYKDLSLNLLKRLYRRKTIGKWQRARFLPKELTRLWLRVSANRIERLQEISDEDAISEGISKDSNGWWKDYVRPYEDGYMIAKNSFRSLWQSINGEDSWKVNPYVWVIEFERTNPPAAVPAD